MPQFNLFQGQKLQLPQANPDAGANAVQSGRQTFGSFVNGLKNFFARPQQNMTPAPAPSPFAGLSNLPTRKVGDFTVPDLTAMTNGAFQKPGVSPAAPAITAVRDSNMTIGPMSVADSTPSPTLPTAPATGTMTIPPQTPQIPAPQNLASKVTLPSGMTGSVDASGNFVPNSGTTGGTNSASSALNGLGSLFNNPASQKYLQTQIDTLTRLGALQTQLAQLGIQSPAELDLQSNINSLTNTLNNSNPTQYLKDNPSLANAGISQGQLERTTGAANLPLTQSLANLVLSKSVLGTQRQNQFNAVNAEATGLTNTATIAGQIRNLSQFGGLPPEVVNTVLQRSLFPQYNVTTDVYGQPIAYNQYDPSQTIHIGQTFAGTGTGSMSFRNNNPGNLKDPQTGQFRTFGSYQEGFNALKSDLLGKMTGATSTPLTANSSLLDFARVYAPSSDNNDPVNYANTLAQQLGVTPQTAIGTLRGRLDDFAKAVQNNEGYFASQGASSPANIQQLPPVLRAAANTVRGVPYIDMSKLTDKEKSMAQVFSSQLGIPLATSNDVEKIQDAETTFISADNLLNTIESMSKELITSTNPGETLGQQVAGLASKIPVIGSSIAPRSRVFNNTVNAFSSLLTRAAGEKGTLTNQDVQRIISALPTLDDTADTAAQKLANLRSIYQSATIGAVQSRLGVGAAQGQSSSADPLGIL